MHWTLNPVGGGWTVAIIAIVLLALCAMRPGLALPPRRRLTLVALRVLACLMVIFALLRPEVVRTKTETLRAALLVLLDSSKSMTVEDSLAGRSRWDAAVDLLEQSGDSLQRLARDNDVLAYRFDETLTPLGDALDAPSGEPTGEGTALGQSLDDLLRNEATERLLGVVLLSDGAQRAVPPNDLAPQVAARRYAMEGVPIFPFAFGTPAGGDRADLAIDDLVASESVFADTPTQVTGQLRVRGYANQPLTIRLLWEDADGQMQAVDAMQVTAGPTAAVYPISLEHTPERLGEQKVQLAVEPRDGEVLTSNNSQSTFVTVREGGVNVLYLVGAKRIGGGPGVEQRFVRAALAASPDILVTRRVINYQPPEINLAKEFATKEYNVFLLDDVDRDAFDRETWGELAQRVWQGAGLMMTGGYHSFGSGGHDSGPMAGVLPVSPGKFDRQQFGEKLRQDVHVAGPVKMAPAEPFGVRHPIMQIGANLEEAWRALPPLTGANWFDRRRLKPNAVVLAEGDGLEKPPLLVASQPGRGRAIAFAGDSTWKWQMAGQGESHRRFWRQAILWLAQQDDSKGNPVWLDLAARRVARGAPLELAVGANPPEENANQPVDFEVIVTRPDGSTQQASLSLGEDGGQGLIRSTDQPGDYTVTVTGKQQDQELGAATARFVVPMTDVELDQPGAEPAVMSQLAQITSDAGGRALAPEELPELLAELAAQDPQVQEEVTARITHWDTWPFFLLLVAMLSAEWFLRKRWGLV